MSNVKQLLNTIYLKICKQSKQDTPKPTLFLEQLHQNSSFCFKLGYRRAGTAHIVILCAHSFYLHM